MNERLAQTKFSCPACGGEAVWTPSKKALVCPYCGTTAPAELRTEADGSTAIVEHDLARALREIPDEARGYRLARTQVRCESCRAVTLFDEAHVSRSCDFCGSSALVPYEEMKEAFRPESVLPMKVSESAVREAIRKWYGSHFFAPNALATRAMTDRVHGLYIPYWTFDAEVSARWTAESGDYYFVSETYQDAQGNRRTRQVRKVRWYPSNGELEHFFDDELVPATQGVDAALLRDVEPFPTRDLVGYDAGFLSGFTVERYQIDLVAAAGRSRAQMDDKLRALCGARVPGDTHRNLEVSADYREQKFKHVLVPVWVLSYTYGRETFQVVVNGVTGKIAGRYPLSGWKIFFAVLGALVVLGLVFYFGQSSG